jgi:hypothetical protein
VHQLTHGRTIWVVIGNFRAPTILLQLGECDACTSNQSQSASASDPTAAPQSCLSLDREAYKLGSMRVAKPKPLHFKRLRSPNGYLSEAAVEQVVLDHLAGLGYVISTVRPLSLACASSFLARATRSSSARNARIGSQS